MALGSEERGKESVRSLGSCRVSVRSADSVGEEAKTPHFNRQLDQGIVSSSRRG